MLGSMLLGVERVSGLIDRCTVYEKLYLTTELQALVSRPELEKTLHNLYGDILGFLAKSYHFFGQSSAGEKLSKLV